MKRMYIHSLSAVSPQPTFQCEGERIYPEKCRFIALEPDYKINIPDAGLRRRMSRIVKMGVASAMDCLSRSNPAEIGAIITATGLGCLGDTEKFMNSILDNDERLLNPTAFIQSTFNTIGAQIALLCENHHYNMTYVHRAFSFESALLDAQLMLSDGEASQILVGAMDELTDTSFRIMERMGFWKNVVAGEGAQFFVLGAQASGNASGNASGIVRGVDTFRGPVTEEEIHRNILDFLKCYDTSGGEIDLILSGGGFSLSGLLPQAYEIDFKQYCGEYQTASSFALWLGVALLQNRAMWDIPAMNAKKVLIYNTYQEVAFGLILLEKAE